MTPQQKEELTQKYKDYCFSRFDDYGFPNHIQTVDWFLSNLPTNKDKSEGKEAVEKPNEIEVGNLVIDKLKQDEFWDNPRNRKTRIVAEILMRECYHCGFNKAIELFKSKTKEGE